MRIEPSSYSGTWATLVGTGELRIDHHLKEELGHLYVGVPGFYEAFFGEIAGLKAVAEAGFKKSKDGNNPLYSEAGGWCEWPKMRKRRRGLEMVRKASQHAGEVRDGVQGVSKLYDILLLGSAIHFFAVFLATIAPTQFSPLLSPHR